MSRATYRIRSRLCARARAEERGFTMVEVIVAIAIIATALTALAYTATIGFTYESLARQKQTATGIADQIMEQVRGLAYDKVTTGHLTTDLVGDPNVVTGCTGDAAGTYRFLACTQNGTPGSGEKLVTLGQACPVGTPDCVYPLIRHTGTVAQNGITFTWRTYDTNNCPTSTSAGCTASTPYRVSVIVTWTGGRVAPNKIVQVQSLFWSPGGCRSTATHAFAAPCQPFFYSVSKVPQANVHVAGSVDGTSFSEGDLFASGAESTLQQEQLSQVQGSFTQSGVRLVDGGGVQAAGGSIAATSAADTDPGTSATTYSTVSCGSGSYPCSGGSVSTSGGGTSLTFTAPNGETATSTSTTQATSGANVCPPPTDTAQNDSKACGGSRIQQGGTLTAVYDMSSSPGIGQATLARILAAASNPNKTFVDRVQYSTSGLCAPVNNSDGCVEVTTTRRVGTLNVGGLPAGITSGIPAGWSGANAWNGYYFSIVGYQDSITAPAGTNSASGVAGANVPAPTASISAGTVYCWNGTNGYNSLAASSSSGISCGTLAIPAQLVNGHLVSVTIAPTSLSPMSTSGAIVTRTPTSAAASQTDVNAQIVPPSATIRYTINVDGLDVASLTMTINLGTLEGRGVYAVAPTVGS